MELAFESRELREICESEAEASQHFGDAVAEMLRHRLADLDAAGSPEELVAGRPRVGEEAETMVVDLCDGHRIVFTPNHIKNPTQPAGGVDWPRVSRIRILRIERDNG